MTGLINDMMFIHQSRITEMNENIKKQNFDQLTKEFQDQENEMEERFTQ